MKRYRQEYLIGKKSFYLNRKIVKGAQVFLNGMLLQSGFDYVKRKRNIKFTDMLSKGDVIIIEEILNDESVG